jgi:hypothetical protein
VSVAVVVVVAVKVGEAKRVEVVRANRGVDASGSLRLDRNDITLASPVGVDDIADDVAERVTPSFRVGNDDHIMALFSSPSPSLLGRCSCLVDNDDSNESFFAVNDIINRGPG